MWQTIYDRIQLSGLTTDPSGYMPAPVSQDVDGSGNVTNWSYTPGRIHFSSLYNNSIHQNYGFSSWNDVNNTITDLSNSTYGGFPSGLGFVNYRKTLRIIRIN